MSRERLPAKLSRPRLFEALPRTRLFERLDTERHRAIVWLSGPPGAGKTTLASTWLETQRGHALWYRIDEDDADPATFFHHLTRLATAHTRKRSLHLPVLTSEYLHALPGFARRFFAAFYAALPANSSLVFDRWEAADAVTLDALLDVAITELPEGLRLLVTSRAEPSPSLLHWQTHGAMAQLQSPELRLTLAEARALAADAPDAADLLHARADGWTAGFVLLLNHLRRTSDAGPEQGHAEPESLFAYFAHERFADSSEAMRGLLLHSALMPAFTAAQATALSNPEAPDLLLRLYREHYFIDRNENPEPSYRYHDLFRAFLLQQGRTHLDPALRNTLLVRAAALLRQAGRTEDALAACIEAGAQEQAISLLCELAPSLIGEGRNAVIERAVAGLSEASRAENPWVAYWLGQARLPFDPGTARRLFERAYARFEVEDQIHPALLACSGVLESFFLEWSDLHGVDRWATAFQRLALMDGAFPDCASEINCRVSLRVLSYRRKGYSPLLHDNEQRLKGLLAETTDLRSGLLAASALLLTNLESGDWNDLRALLTYADASVLQLREVPSSAMIVLNMIKSAVHWQAGELQPGLSALAQCRHFSESTGVRVFDTLVAGQGVYAALAARDLALAQSYLDAMTRSGTHTRTLDSAHFDWLRGALALARGDAHTALDAARACVATSIACGADLPELHGNLLLVQARCASGNLEEALELLDSTITRTTALRIGVVQLAAMVLKADLLLEAGDSALGHETLRAAFELSRASGCWLSQPWVPWQVLQRCCIAALRAGIEVAYVTEMIARQRLPAPEIDLAQWPWPIRIYTLGSFSVLRANEPLRFHGKAQRKPLELLKALIALGAQDVGQDQLIGLLWPEPPADGGQKVLDVTLHRLRALLDNADAIHVSDRRVSLDRDRVWVDVFEVERLLSRPSTADNEANTEDTERATGRLLELYVGEFLGNESEHPALLQRRHRLHDRFANHVRQAGIRYKRASRWTDAAAIYQRCVELDPVAEASYREWMHCLSQLGQHAEAIAVYQRCRTMLSLLLGTRPNRETDALRAQILAVTNSGDTRD